FVNAVVQPDFSLAASPASQTVSAGGSTSYTVTISPTGGFTGQVSLSVSGLPSGASGTFTPNPATASSTFAVTTSASTPGGTYSLTIAGVSGGSPTHSTTVSLVVTPPDFTLSASPSGLTVTRRLDELHRHNQPDGRLHRPSEPERERLAQRRQRQLHTEPRHHVVDARADDEREHAGRDLYAHDHRRQR